MDIRAAYRCPTWDAHQIIIMLTENIAVIDETRCIGCTKCIQACPFDAILGAPKCLHTVLQDECTGCNLCVNPCPVDCITLVPFPEIILEKAQRANKRMNARNERLKKAYEEKLIKFKDKTEKTKIQEEILAVLQRVQKKRENCLEPKY